MTRAHPPETVLASEIRYRRLFETARDGILILDAETGDIIDVNPYLIELLGFSREQFLGKKVWEIGTFRDIFASKEKFAELQDVGYVRYDDLPLQAADGRKVQVEFVSNVYREDRQNVIQCNIRDNTVRNQARIRLSEKDLLLSEAQKLGHVGSWYWAMSGRIAWSDEMYRVYGVSPDTFTPTQESLVGLVHPDDQAAMRAWIAACAAGEGPGDLEYRIKRPDGSIRYLMGRGELSPAVGGNPAHMAGTTQDITERRLAQAQSERLAALVDASPDFIGFADPKTAQIQYINKHGRMMCGIGEDEDVSKLKIGDVHPAWMNRLMAEVILPAAERDGSWEGEAAFLNRDGREIPVSMVLLARKTANGEIDIYYTVSRDITERKHAESELQRLKTAIEQAGDAIVITDLAGAIVYANPAFETATGYSRQEVLGKTPRVLKSGRHDEAFYRELWGTITSGRIWKGRLVNKRKDGTLRIKDATISPIRDSGGRITNFVSVHRDITERLRLEGELLQSQKMESVGRLAGGVAHDFNNILTAINGYASIVMEGLPAGDQKRDDLAEVLAAGERATRLTKQLLAFSRKQILNPQNLDLNAAIGATVNMLKRLIGDEVKLETRLAAQPCLVKVDAGQLDQVILNLAVNARDAMLKGGTLTFETGIVAPDEGFWARHPDLPRGLLVCLSARDTGCGMTGEVKSHLFEPFFTTKEKGKGTGLGLATVYGIIKQSGGEIEVESSPGHGTTFRIYLPRIGALLPAMGKAEGVVLRGSETVLLVDDEDSVRRVVERVLSGHGYTVLVASSGPEALAALERHGRPVDLLLTDVVMRGMSGRELARAIAAQNMARRTLFISGYTDDAIVAHGVLEAGLSFMYKPFLPDALLRKLREVLDGPADQAKA